MYFYVTLFSLRHSVCVDMCAWRGEEVVERGGGCGEGTCVFLCYLLFSVSSNRFSLHLLTLLSWPSSLLSSKLVPCVCM